MKLIKYLFAGISLLNLSTLNAQYNSNTASQMKFLSRWMAGMYIDWGIASHLFAQNMDEKHGFGLGGELLFNIRKDEPIWTGIGVHKFSFDDERLGYSQEIDGIFYNYEDHTASRVFMLHGVVRFQPDVRFLLKPYLQGGAGMHWFYTNTKIKDTDYDEQLESINESRDAVLGFALHAGFQYVPRRLPDIRLDARFGYFRNASVEYMRYNPSLSGGFFPIDYFETKVSAVDIFGIHIGVTAMLSPSKEIFDE